MQREYHKYIVKLLFLLLCFPLEGFAQDNTDTTSVGSSITLPEPTNFSREIIYDPVSEITLFIRKLETSACQSLKFGRLMNTGNTCMTFQKVNTWRTKPCYSILQVIVLGMIKD